MNDTNKPLARPGGMGGFPQRALPRTGHGRPTGSKPPIREEEVSSFAITSRTPGLPCANSTGLTTGNQSYDFSQAKRKEFLSLNRRQMSVWEALEFLNTLVDDSDPDTDLSQLDHLLQTAEQIRNDGHPRWFILTGLIHDLGKIFVSTANRSGGRRGRHFSVGCSWSDRIVFHQFFADNPDSQTPRYQTAPGRLPEHCGLGQRHHVMGPTTNIFITW
jgi:inositol oxygenase